MRQKNILIISIILLLMFSLMSCTNKAEYKETLSEISSTTDKITVFTTIYPLSDFTNNIGGKYVEVINLIPTGAEPHSWEPSPKDIAKLNQADIFIYSGAGLEPWVEPILNSLDTSEIVVVDSSIGIKVKDSKDRQSDPHIWLDPFNAKIQVNNIATALIESDLANASYYRQNQAIYLDKLEQLHQHYQNKLAVTANTKFITSHAAFGYLAERYGLEQISLRGLSPEVEPSPARLAEIVKLCQENNIKYIFFEHFVSDKVSKTIANEIGGGTLILHPLGGVTKEQLVEGQDYIALMNENLDNLLIALGDHDE